MKSVRSSSRSVASGASSDRRTPSRVPSTSGNSPDHRSLESVRRRHVCITWPGTERSLADISRRTFKTAPVGTTRLRNLFSESPRIRPLAGRSRGARLLIPLLRRPLFSTPSVPSRIFSGWWASLGQSPPGKWLTSYGAHADAYLKELDRRMHEEHFMVGCWGCIDHIPSGVFARPAWCVRKGAVQTLARCDRAIEWRTG